MAHPNLDPSLILKTLIGLPKTLDNIVENVLLCAYPPMSAIFCSLTFNSETSSN